MLLEAPQRLILDKSPTGYCVVGPDGMVQWANRTLEQHVGMKIINTHSFAPEVAAWISSRLEYAKIASDPSEKQIYFKDWGSVHLQPLDPRILDGDWLLSFTTLKPVSDRESLFYETVFQACPIPIFVEDFSAVHRYIQDRLDTKNLRSILENDYDMVRRLADFVIIKDANQAALEIMKSTKDEIVGRLTRTLREPTYPAFIDELVAISEGRTHLEIEAPIDTTNKNLTQTRIYIRFPENPAHYTNIFVTIVDIDPYVAERRSLQEQRQHAMEASRSKSELVANLSHEMRTPLNGIIGFANLLSHLTVDEEHSEFVASILSCSQSLQHLINDVLDFTKIEAGEMLIRNQPFTLSDVINEVALGFKSRAEERNLSFNLQIDERLAPTYEGDPIRITQLLNNLLSNAEKFTKAGSISLEVHVKPSDQAVQFLVRDTGIGVQESWLKHLSQALEQKEPFTLERLGGTCLNIATSIKVAEMMGGSIHIEPGIPEGTLSILQLPLNTIRSSEGDSQPEIKKPEFIDPCDQRVRVLAVDDNEVNLKLISFLLKHRQDIEVILSSSGEKALEHLERGAFDAILLDLQMPGLDGFETCNKIRSGEAGSHHKEIPIAALTAHTTTENRKKAQNCAMNAFIEKPMKPKEVFRFLSEFTRAT